MKAKKIEISAKETEALLERVKNSTLVEGDYEIIKGLFDTYILLNQAVTKKSTSIKRLLHMLFGNKTEKTKKDSKKKGKRKKRKTKGHGKNGADEYIGAERVQTPHATLHHCDPCPTCNDGKLCRQRIPGVVVRIKGAPPLQAIVYEQEKLRCNICGGMFTAALPVEAGSQKYDETASAMLAHLRYGCGLPFNRIAKLQRGMGIPLAPSTQWDVIEKMADKIHPVFLELIRQAAQGDVIHNDDTSMKVQELIAENHDPLHKPSRSGIFTTNILSIKDDRKTALFFTGRNHAGENMAKLLRHRQNCLDPPVQMCDALSRNTSEEFQTLLANCLVHSRRNFVDVAGDFPDECQYVIKTLGKVYRNDAITSEKKMSSTERLHFHWAKSGPLMKKLHSWFTQQFDDKKVEPNSSLGKAITYMLKHWNELTLFLYVEKAPLDNNICERAIKMAILHRKNSLFYKTEHGAYIGDMFMSLIHTCALSQINPFEYLTALQKNSSAVFRTPQEWLPWNYQEKIDSAVS